MRKTSDQTPPERPYALPLRDLIELPHDSFVEMGTPLLISPNPEQEPMDEKAPLFLRYSDLAKSLQMLNAANDALGAEVLEMRHHYTGNIFEAFKLTLNLIALDPENEEYWNKIDKKYSYYLRTRPADTMFLFWEFLQAAGKEFGSDRGVPRCRTLLCLAYYFKSMFREDSLRHLLREIWRLARKADSPGVNRALISVLFYNDDILDKIWIGEAAQRIFGGMPLPESICFK